MLRDLDVFGCKLEGTTLIEASAGTGKTWNICALYLRFLLEARLTPEQILVVTFTKAATAELRERIRSRITALVATLERGESVADADDPMISGLAGAIDALSPGEALARLRYAQRSFDQSAIHTIHAFCQRALTEAPFAAGAPLEFEVAESDAPLRFRLASAFWRERVQAEAARVPRFAAWLVDRQASPLDLDRQLGQRLKKPMARVDFCDDAAPGDAVACGDERQTLFEAAATLWQQESDGIAALLDTMRPTLRANVYKEASVTAGCAGWSAYLGGGDCWLAARDRKAMGLLAATKLRANLKKGHTPVDHAFFELAERLLTAIERDEDRHRRTWLALLREWLDRAPADLERLKQRTGRLVFDDLLAQLHRALCAHRWLGPTLARRFPAALIDEFQDTDPLQFDIFRRIYADQARRLPLFLVGDPKQAIYAFRSADLHTYLAARDAAEARFTLGVNQRSTAEMIAACNRFFGANTRAFLLPGLDYQPVRAGQRERPPFSGGERGPVAALHVWRLPLAADGAAPGGGGAEGSGAEEGGADAAPADKGLSARDAQRWAAQACADEIVRLLEQAHVDDEPLAGADVAVLVRTHRQGALMKRLLAERGVGAVELAQASVFASADAEEVERVLRAIESPADARRMNLALAGDWIGLDAASLAALASAAGASDTAGAVDDGGQAGIAGAALDDAMHWIERFGHYRTLWLERGFPTMWRQLMRELRVPQRLAGLPDGERRLTDVNHLGELLHERAAESDGIAPLLRWLADSRAERGGEDAQLRLESDRDLVQIVTVHKSKGLEYAVVFCPFLYESRTARRGSARLPDPVAYRDDGRVVLAYELDAERSEAAAQQALIEAAAEDARLIYVALTRAVYRAYLVSGAVGGKPGCRSVLNWLVAGEGQTFETWHDAPLAPEAIDAYWARLRDDVVSVAPIPVPRLRRLRRAAPPGAVLQARTLRRRPAAAWQLLSFTGLLAGARDAGARHDGTSGADDAGVADSPRPEHDDGFVSEGTGAVGRMAASDRFAIAGFDPDAPEFANDADSCVFLDDLDGPGGAAFADLRTAAYETRPPERFDSVDPREAAARPGALAAAASAAPNVAEAGKVSEAAEAVDNTLLGLPRGTAAGSCLHHLLEHVDFAKPERWDQAVAASIAAFPSVATAFEATRGRSGTAGAASLADRLRDVVAALADVELAPGTPLCRLPASRCLRELAFTFPLSATRLRSDGLAATLVAAGYGLPELAPRRLHGFMKGFIDLVFEADGRFYIVDWKSNDLGDTLDAYLPVSMTDAMARHGYWLQAVLYTVALHRHLRATVADYDYDRDMGGVAYVFARGVSPSWRLRETDAGVLRHRFARDLIESIDVDFAAAHDAQIGRAAR
ncbi:UvrD-helicase domain-containing protein [Chitinasiproducens palmae]|nr:UvrD-helicase domain-containing protein [Chitinasiproducens palmae]